MGTIIIKVPQEIQLECEIEDVEAAAEFLETVKSLQKKPAAIEKDLLAGLFSDEPELIEQITEMAMQARENDPLRRSGA